MVRNYKRKTSRGEWTEESMKNAVTAVVEGKMGYKSAAKQFLVPQTTLERKVKNARDNNSTALAMKVPLGPRNTTFTAEEEDELLSYIHELEIRLFGLSAKELQGLAFQLAVKNNKVHYFNNEKGMAGDGWLQGFLKRHPTLSLRKPENTSAARAAGFNEEVVTQFFHLLGNLYDEYTFEPDRVYNCDETGVSVVPKSKGKILAMKGRKQVGSLASAERGKTVTVEVCFSATGKYMPPMFIFGRKRMDPNLMINAFPGSWAECSDSGWVTSEIFLKWFKKFVKFSGASKERPILLLLDGHSTHTKNIELIDEARENGVILLCFPPHTTHKMQPLDVSFMKPLSTYYDQALTTWLRSHPGAVVTQHQVAELFGKAFIQAATMSTAINGFKKCGIWPCDANVFSNLDFVPSTTYSTDDHNHPDSVLADPGNDTPTNTAQVYSASNVYDVEEHTPAKAPNRNQATSIFSPQPSCSTSVTTASPQLDCSSSFVLTSPKQLLPIPQSSYPKRKIVQKRGKTAILTSSPYKKEVEEANKKAKLKNQKAAEKQSTQEKKKKKNKRPARKRSRKASSSDESIEEQDTQCLYCSGFYLQSNEGWITCQVCGQWAHCTCAGVDDDDEEAVHICPDCRTAQSNTPV